ncbi:MAG: hypothetical protein ACTSX8_04885 [Alphaproteobacteria bacterium]
MLTKYLKREVKRLKPRTRGVFLLLVHATASPRGRQQQFNVDRIDTKYSTLKITADELKTGLAEMAQAGLIAIDGKTITIQPRLFKSLERIDENDPEQAGWEHGILRDYCYGEIPYMRRPRPQIWCEEIDDTSIAFEFRQYTVTCWCLKAMAPFWHRPLMLRISPYNDHYEGNGELEIVAMMASELRFKARRKLKRAKLKEAKR